MVGDLSLGHSCSSLISRFNRKLYSRTDTPIQTLRNISIQPIILPLQKLLLNQPINVPLDPTNLQCPPIPSRLDSLTHQLSMTDPLACLQDPDNSSLGFVVAVGSDAFVRLLVLGCCFLELDGVDLDAVFGVCKGSVERERVGFVDLSAFGVFGQGPYFCASEGLEGAV